MFWRVCYLVFFKCDEVTSCFTVPILSKDCVVVELWCFVRFLLCCFLYGGYVNFVLV